jgi:hypothetical protein
MSNVNGAGVILPAKAPMDEYQQACIDLLADALEEATKGRITAVALVVCMEDGMATVMAGKNGAALNIGCDDLKKKIHAAMFEDGNMARKRSAIMRAR